DRLGLANLPNGYADIETIPEAQNPESSITESAPDTKEKSAKAEVHYRARLPYADMRISFNGKTALVSAFGKRGALRGVPTVLDAALEPQREKLRAAAQGKGSLDTALDARAIGDALKLQLGGKDNMKELRRLYPHGLSTGTAQEILSNMR